VAVDAIDSGPHTSYDFFMHLLLSILSLVLSLSVVDAKASAFIHRAEQKMAENFEVIVEQNSRGLDFDIVGGSLIQGNKLLKRGKGTVDLSNRAMVAAYLLWSGEVDEGNHEFKQLSMITPDGQRHQLDASKTWRVRSKGIVYTALKDVTSLVRQSGEYQFLDLQSSSFAGGDISVGGWALILIFEKKRPSLEDTYFRLQVGLDILPPGEIYGFNFYKNSKTVTPVKFAAIGGHAVAGNGSAVYFSDSHLIKKGEWNGSSGERWDVDILAVKTQRRSSEYIIKVDPLLQWIYPVAFIATWKL
jgi:hypothetical protein